MDFFEKLGNTISNASKDVTKKTKDLTETAKLNSQISKEQSTIEQKYREIGKAFYNKYATTEDTELKELCNDVKNAFDKIEELKKQLNIVKGLIICPRCGTENKIESSFCSSCGEPLKQKDDVETEAINVEVQENAEDVNNNDVQETHESDTTSESQEDSHE